MITALPTPPSGAERYRARRDRRLLLARLGCFLCVVVMIAIFLAIWMFIAPPDPPRDHCWGPCPTGSAR